MFASKNDKLLEAAKEGDLQKVTTLLNKGAKADDSCDKKGWTPMHWASSNGHLEVVQLLLDQRANVDPTNNDKETPLHRACYDGHLDVVQLLLGRRANVHATDNDQRTPLLWASWNGHLEVVRLLLDRGANIQAANNDKQTPLHWASWNGYSEVARLLLDRGANVQAADHEKQTPLHWASWNGHLEIVRLLLDSGADKNLREQNGSTPLDYAIGQEHHEIAKLIEGDDDTPLDDAKDQNHHDITELPEYFEQKATVTPPCEPTQPSPDDIPNPNNATDNFEVWSDAVFDDAAEDQGLDLHFAVKYSEEKELKKILSGALEAEVINQADSKGRTALDLAALTGQNDLMAILEDKGAKHNENGVRMRVIAKKRCANVENYRQCVANTLG